MIASIGPAEIEATTGGDVYATLAATSDPPPVAVWADRGAVLWLRGDAARAWNGLSGVGSPAGAAAVVAAVRSELPAGVRASLPRGWTEHMPAGFVLGEASDWDWMWTATAPAVRPGEDRVRWLDPTDHEEVASLLKAAAPGSSVWPGDDRALRWAGLRTADDRLVACLADTSRQRDVGHFSSVATHPDVRGQGHGAALTAWATRRYLAEGARLVTLGMYADNGTARRVYERLGYTCDHRFTAGLLDGPPGARAGA